MTSYFVDFDLLFQYITHFSHAYISSICKYADLQAHSATLWACWVAILKRFYTFYTHEALRNGTFYVMSSLLFAFSIHFDTSWHAIISIPFEYKVIAISKQTQQSADDHHITILL